MGAGGDKSRSAPLASSPDSVFPLLAQLVAPPLQNSPVRLPGPDAIERRPAPDRPAEPVPVELETEPEGRPTPGPDVPPSGPGAPEPLPPGAVRLPGLPAVQGLSVYNATALAAILEPCRTVQDPADRLQACASALTARLVSDGYINSRVYVRDTPAPGFLEVMEGRVVELRVNTANGRLRRRVERRLGSIVGEVLHLPSVEEQLQLIKREPGVRNVRVNLSRLGSDPSQAVFTVSLEATSTPWQGEFSLGNDGSNGSGEYRAIGTVAKTNLATRGDTLLLYGEGSANNNPSLGALITSISYTIPLADQWNFTGAFGYSRRNQIDLPPPADGLSSSQYQGLGQVEWVFRETLRQRWSLFAGLSLDRGNTYLDGRSLPATVPESVRSPRNGYGRLGIAANGLGNSLGWAGNIYLLQGIAAATPELQRKELETVNLDPGRSSAVGGLISTAWAFAPGWQLNLRAGGQWAFYPLTNSMQFTLGSNAGLRGLPAQFISGDSGWLGTGEVAWTLWQRNLHTVQLVPFLGAGGIATRFPGLTLTDTVGAGGVFARWLVGEHWNLELGWVEQFSTNDNPGEWADGGLGRGLYSQLRFSF